MKKLRMIPGAGRAVRAVPILALLVAIPVAGIAQTPEPLNVTGKLAFHVERTVGPLALVGDAAHAGILQAAAAPTEWGGGA